jgi:hypothetical protein
MKIAKKSVYEQNSANDDIASSLKNLRMNPPTEADSSQKKLIKQLGQPKCPPELLLWASLFGSVEMKQSVAKNKGISTQVCEALMMDAEFAPYYVFSLMENQAVFARFIKEVYGPNNPFPDVLNMSDLYDETEYCYQDEKWKSYIPNQGSSNVLQAELIRILWRFGRTLNYCVAYTVDYDDEMFIVLNFALDRISNISSFGKNVLRAFLRWSQIQQRARDNQLPKTIRERYDPVNIVVDVFLRNFPDPIPFDQTEFMKGIK